MRKLVLATAALTALGITGTAIAESHMDPAIKRAITARQSLMQLYAFNIGTLGAMAKGDMPYEAEMAQTAADNLAMLAKVDQQGMWPQGSDTESVDGTDALPAIWEDMSGVMEDIGALQEASAQMAEVAGQGLDEMRGAMRPLGGACGSCHEDYRKSDD